MISLIPLHTLSPGQSAVIRQLLGKPDDVRRLEELGMRAGQAVEMVDAGVPCIVRLAGAKLCFRGAEAFQVMVASPEAALSVAALSVAALPVAALPKLNS
jgi:Fe2+ transport system protein FeoA